MRQKKGVPKILKLIGDSVKKRIIISIITIVIMLIIVTILYILKIIPHKKYDNSYFGIEQYISNVDKDNDGLLCLQTQRNRLLRADCHGTVRARYDDHCTAGSERFRDFAFKVVKTGNVDQVDLDVLPGDGSNRKRNGHLARNFLLVKVGDGGAVLDLAHALNDAAVKEHRFKQCGFAFTAVPDNGNIADILCRNTHIKTPYQKCICGKLFICNNC